MSRKLQATVVIVGSFLLWLVIEVAFNADHDWDTPTITQLVLENLHPELVVFLAGGFAIWFAFHFISRAWRRAQPERTEESMQTPSLGRVVLVPADPKTSGGGGEAPATITRVWSENADGWVVNLRVLADGDGVPEWRTSVTLCETKEKAAQVGPHVAWWPPRVS